MGVGGAAGSPNGTGGEAVVAPVVEAFASLPESRYVVALASNGAGTVYAAADGMRSIYGMTPDGQVSEVAALPTRSVRELVAPDSPTIAGGKAALKRGRATWHHRSGPMLPVPVQFIVAMLAYAPGERMARRLDSLQEEHRVFKDAFRAATGKTRIALTDEQR